MKLILSMDPGTDGSICIMDTDGKIKGLHKMPIFKIKTGKLTKKGNEQVQTQIDFRGLFNLLEPIYKNNEVVAYIEQITHLFGLPSSSNFKLGYCAGICHAILQTFGDFYMVKPAIWQKEVWETEDHVIKITDKGRKKKDPKETSKACAVRLFPEESFIPKGGRSMHDGLIDAALICEYARRQT